MLNGKPPDKTHLKMFDLIYYNPATNPMKNPAKSVKDRRLSSVSDESVQNVKKEEQQLTKIETQPEVKHAGKNKRLIKIQNFLIL